MNARWLVLLLGLGCRSGEQGDVPPDSTDGDTLAAAAAADTALPPMPGIPDHERGSLVAVAVGAFDSTWVWPARAGRCVQPPMVFIIPSELGNSGGTVLLELPPGNFSVEYPVRFADSTGMPEPPAAMLGFQFFDQQRGDAYQALAGTVTVTALDERKVSGHFQVTVRHILTERRARVAGTFSEVPVEPMDPTYCRTMQSAQDSLAVPQPTR
jgi:hypothetical protein